MTPREPVYDCFDCNGQQSYYNPPCDNYMHGNKPNADCLWRQVADSDTIKRLIGDEYTTLDDMLGYHRRKEK